MDTFPLVRVNCARCGGWDADRVIQTPDYELHIDAPFEISLCRNCGHIYTSVRPDYNTLFSKFYPDDYLCYGGKSGVAGLMDRKRMEGQAAQRAEMVKKFVGQPEPRQTPRSRLRHRRVHQNLPPTLRMGGRGHRAEQAIERRVEP